MDRLLAIIDTFVKLSFSNPTLEKRFQKYYLEASLPQNILVAKITILLYLTYVPLIHFFIVKNELLLLTLVSMLGIAGAYGLVVVSKLEFFEKHTKSVLWTTAVMVGIAPLIYYVLTDNSRALFQVDILLPVVGIFTMYGVTFSLASVSVLSIIIIFIFLSLLTGLDAYEFFAGIYVLISGSIVVGLASYFMEKSQRKLFLAKNSNAEYKFIVENAQDSIAVFDVEEMHYLYANAIATSCNGDSKKSIVGKKLQEFHPEFTQDVVDAIRRRLDKEGNFSDVYQLYSVVKKAYYYAHIVIQYGCYEGKKAIITFSSDVTPEKEAEIKMQEMALHDPLTGLYNRYKFDDASQEQIALFARYKSEVSLILCDIDHFKNVNDQYGHAVGDEVLKQIASIIKGVVRESDIVARWGGEEFAVLLPNTPKIKAIGVADKIRQSISTVSFGVVGKITLSCGVSQLETDETQIRWFNRVDEALYEAKSSGRNRVCTK